MNEREKKILAVMGCIKSAKAEARLIEYRANQIASKLDEIRARFKDFLAQNL